MSTKFFQKKLPKQIHGVILRTPKEILMTFGERIRITREKKNMTQEDLALAIGLKTKAAVSKIEKGIVQPNQKTIAKIAEALGVSPVVFFGYYEDDVVEFLPYLAEADSVTLDNIRAILHMPPKKICKSEKVIV